MDSSICVATTTGMPRLERLVDDALLGHGDVFERYFNAQIPSSHHHSVGKIEDAVEVIKGRRVLNFCQNRHVH